MLQYGHINFDRIQISALKSSGYDVRLIMHYNIAKQLMFPLSDYELIIPKYLGINSDNPILNRLLYILILLYIKVKVRINSFDKTIVSNLDEITLGIVPLSKKMYIFSHSNSNDFNFKIKKIFLKRLSKNNNIIVFNELMKEPYISNGIQKIFVISHGCLPPFKFLEYHLPIDISKFNFIVFHPSTKIDETFKHELRTNVTLHHFLTKNNFALIVRDQDLVVNKCNNIIIIRDYLATEQYQALFVASDVILLVYPDTFKYKVSGISYEAFANNKKLLIYKNPALDYCIDYYNYDPMFLTIEQLCTKIEYLYQNHSAKCMVKGNTLSPNYSLLLNDF